MRKILFFPLAIEHLNWWLKVNPKLVLKIFELANNAAKMPFEGLGKPEALKANRTGYWSRRITLEDRMIYKVEEDAIVIISAKGHY
jgi:toxin YoeB